MRDASRARSRLALSRAVASALCAFMIAWILFAPGSCSPASVHRVRSETPGDAVLSREGSVAAVVPPSLVNKYAAHPAVCASHVLPAAVWSAAVIAQLSPALRARRPSVHRVSGRVAIAAATLVTAGFVEIDRRDLHFHGVDFPTLARGEALSYVGLERFWRRAGKVVRFAVATIKRANVPATGWVAAPGLEEATGEDADDDDDAAAAYVAFERCSAAWFLFTAWAAAFRAAFPNRTKKTPRHRHRRAAHRAWATRHVAAGVSVAAQRWALLVAHAGLRAAGADSASPEAQKGIFADALLFGVAACVLAGEAAVRDFERVDEERGGEKTE
jgi:hypothetical protein